MIYTVSEAARLLHVSERTIQTWIKEGSFPNAFKLHPQKKNSPIRIPKADIDRFLSSRAAPRA